MKDNILEQLGKYRAPSSLPAIAMRAFALYEAAGFRMTAEAIDQLRDTLNADKDDLKKLTDLNIGLGVFALYLRDTLEDLEGAELVARLMRETAPVYRPLGERIVAALQDLAITATELLDRFSGHDSAERHRAPKCDEADPPGTVPLKRLKSPEQLKPRRAPVT